MTRPVRGVTVIGLAFGAYLLISAATALVGALAGQRDRSLGVMRGVADLVAGLIVVSWPGIGLLALAIVLGVYLVARGVLDVSGALAVRRGRIT